MSEKLNLSDLVNCFNTGRIQYEVLTTLPLKFKGF